MHCRRILSVLVAAFALVVGFAGAAAAQDLDAIIDDVAFRGYAIEVGADADVNEIEDALASIGDDVALVVLADDVAAGNDRIADEVRAAIADAHHGAGHLARRGRRHERRRRSMPPSMARSTGSSTT